MPSNRLSSLDQILPFDIGTILLRRRLIELNSVKRLADLLASPKEFASRPQRRSLYIAPQGSIEFHCTPITTAISSTLNFDFSPLLIITGDLFRPDFLLVATGRRHCS